MILPATGDISDLGEGTFQQHVFLIIYYVNTGPVDSYYDLIPRKSGPRESISLVEAWKQ